MEDKLRKIISIIGKSEEDVKQEFQKLFEVVKKENPNITDNDAKAEALRLLFITYRRELRTPSEIFTGFIVGDTGVVDVYDRRRKLANELLAKNPQQALTLGLVNTQFQLIDKKGRVIEKPLMIRRLFGIIKKENGYKNMQILIGERNSSMLEVSMPLFTWTTFRANVSRKSTPDNMLLNLTTVPSPTSITENVYDIIRSNFIIRKLTDLPTYLQQIQQSVGSNVPVYSFTEGYIVDIRGSDKDKDVKTVVLWDEGVENDVPCFIRKPIKDTILDVNWKVLIFGRVMKREKGVAITGLGILPIKKYGG